MDLATLVTFVGRRRPVVLSTWSRTFQVPSAQMASRFTLTYSVAGVERQAPPPISSGLAGNARGATLHRRLTVEAFVAERHPQVLARGPLHVRGREGAPRFPSQS